jgi:riboflavin synthase
MAASRFRKNDMFTGIIEETGVIGSIKPTAKSIQMTIRANKCAAGLKLGDSLAVNGCCLTVVELSKQGRGKLVRVDLLKETWERTNFPDVKPGSLVNLERPLKIGARLDGHFVTGHVDGTGKIIRWERAGQDHVLEVQATAEIMRYLVFKGSICVDGISLTVALVKKNSFRLWIIPHTYEVTALQERKVGDMVNLEADIIGKYVRKFVTS